MPLLLALALASNGRVEGGDDQHYIESCRMTLLGGELAGT